MSCKEPSFPYGKLPALLLPWFSQSARPLPWRRDKNPYHVWLSEIMLQQTRVEAVRAYYMRFIKAFPDIAALGAADTDEVLKLWEGLGYYSRARNLQKAAQKIMREYGGCFPSSYSDILALPGVGAYTAGAISSICFEQPTPAVDGNVLRLWARLTAYPAPVDTPSVKKEVTHALAEIYPEGQCGNFTQSLMELGELICIPKAPRCQDCPLSSLCLGYQKGLAASLPIRTPKRARTISKKTVFLLQADGKIAVRKREDTGLLAGLWELPNIEGEHSAQEAVAKAKEWGAAPLAPLRAVARTHIFTHAEWDMLCYYIPCKKMPDLFFWADKTALRDAIALPTAFRMFLEDENE